MNILVVRESEENYRTAIKSLKKMVMANFSEANSVQTAFDLISKTRFRFVVSDIYLSDGSGIRLFKYSEQSNFGDTTFIMLDGQNNLPLEERDKMIVLTGHEIDGLVDTLLFLGAEVLPI